jgi:hypothetical protein
MKAVHAVVTLLAVAASGIILTGGSRNSVAAQEGSGAISIAE